MKTFRYSSNNSGGTWWLTDENWQALEKAGWTVEWYKGKADFNNEPYLDDRFLGALATAATKKFLSEECAVAEFNTVAQQNYEDQGCECCGSPHYITEEYQ